MKLFHVYVEKDGTYKAVETTGCQSVEEVELRLPRNVGWYGTNANNAEEAIAKAKAQDLKYVPPERMQSLEVRARALRTQLYQPQPFKVERIKED